jgi:hypothetical protein
MPRNPLKIQQSLKKREECTGETLCRPLGSLTLSVGARAVLVHAVDQGAIPFYARYGFRSLPTNTQTLFLPNAFFAD